MFQSYLLQYHAFLSLGLLSIGAALLFRSPLRVASLMIGLSAITMLALKIGHELTFSPQMITYSYDDQGQVLAANVEFTVWQSASLWVEPIGMVLVAIGFFLVAWTVRCRSMA